MKKLFSFLICFVCIGLYSYALEDSTSTVFIWPEKKPKFQMTVHTRQNQVIKGLLVDVNDSTLILFPGKVDDWKKRNRYQPLYLPDSSIEYIKVKNKNAAGTGALSGLAIGSIPLFAATSDSQNAEAYAIASVFTIPAGLIAGALIGGGHYKKFIVSGNREAFQVFKNKYKN